MITIRRILLATAVSLALVASATSARAYPVDCAIFLCLAGGWPANPVCAQAKGVFMARITPWPVEPPLQIWRCPMGGGATAGPSRVGGSTLGAEAASGSTPPIGGATGSAANGSEPSSNPQADVDISDPAFDTIRGVRVYHVQYAQRTFGGGAAGEECQRSDGSRLGTYSAQGGFRWQEVQSASIPSGPGLSAFDPPPNCRWYRYRSVAVTWTDALGAMGFEEVRY